MSLSQSNLLVAGLPSAGKTTFLAALWHCVTDGRVPGALHLEKLHGDRKYLDQIRNAWLECTPVGRTSPSAATSVRMELADDSGVRVALEIPDLSGEIFERQWSKRDVSIEYEKLVQGISGALLFLHPEHVIESTSIEDACDPISPHIDSESVMEADSALPVAWSPDRSPTAVQLVEILQVLATCRQELTLPLVTLVSAWDVVYAQKQTPDEWIQNRLPLLHQFLHNNPLLFPHRRAGISAQGGSHADNTGRERLLKEQPSDRIRLVNGADVSNDITLPIRWLVAAERPRR